MKLGLTVSKQRLAYKGRFELIIVHTCAISTVRIVERLCCPTIDLNLRGAWLIYVYQHFNFRNKWYRITFTTSGNNYLPY